MASSIIRRKWFLWPGIGSGFQSAVGTNASANIVCAFAETLRAGPAAAQFTATVNGVARAVNSVSVAGSNLTVVLASAVSTGQTVVITYVRGATPAQRLATAAGVEYSDMTMTDVV